MIKSIRIEGFKSLASVELKLGHFNLLIGTNASGKSNFLDALRFLQGVAYGFTIDEILNGKPKSATSEVWEAIRGGSDWASFRSRIGTPASRFIGFQVVLAHPQADLEYRLSVSSKEGRIIVERAYLGDKPFVTCVNGRVRLYSLDNKSYRLLQGRLREKSCLNRLPAERYPKTAAAAAAVVRTLSDVQRLEPTPALLRDYSQAASIRRMGERGENFAGLVRTIIENEKEHTAYVGWLKELSPIELDDVTTLAGVGGDSMFALREGDITSPARVLSDGTLRFAAIAAAFFQPDMPKLLTLEDIEDGLHPTRLRLMLNLLSTQSLRTGTQVFATTHSPLAVDWALAFGGVRLFYFRRDEKTGESIVKPLDAKAYKGASLGDLISEGWLEAMA